MGRNMRLGKAKLVAILFLLVAILIGSLIPLIATVSSGVPPTYPIKGPNAYGTLVEAGSKVVEGQLFEDDTIHEFLAANTVAAEMIETVVHQQSQVVIDYDRGKDGVLDSIGKLRNALRVQWAKGRVAELDTDYDAAAREYGTLLQLAEDQRGDGLLVHEMVGIAFHKMALEGLKEVIPHIKDEHLVGELMGTVGGNMHGAVDVGAIRQREEYLIRRTHGIGAYLVTKWHARDFGSGGIEAAHTAKDRTTRMGEEVLEMLGKQGEMLESESEAEPDPDHVNP